MDVHCDCANIECNASDHRGPVCSKDGDTYENGCSAVNYQCSHQREVTIVHQGPCQTGECIFIIIVLLLV